MSRKTKAELEAENEALRQRIALLEGRRDQARARLGKARPLLAELSLVFTETIQSDLEKG